MAELIEHQTTPVEAFKKGFDDFDYFSRLCMPGIIEFTFPVFYLAIWQMLVAARTKEDKIRILRFALGLPRGFAKTTFIKILIAWFIVYGYTEFVLIVCADEPLAYNLLSDIDDILASENMELVYGKWTINKGTNQREKKTAIYRGKPLTLIACGAGSNVRGLNIKNERPDLILFDDMQTSDNATSDVEYSSLLTKFTGTFLKLVSPKKALIVYIGNMYPANCILALLRDNPYWVSMITGCILSNGESLWPELHPIEVLYESFKHDASINQGHIWFAEMMNDPVESRTALLPDGVLPNCKYTKQEIEDTAIGGFIVIDPSGYRKLSDDNVIMVHMVMSDENTVVIDGVGGVLDPEKVILQTVELALAYNISIIGVESVAYQQTLKFWLDKYLELNSLQYIQVVELKPAGRAKELRIIAWFKEILSGYYHIFDHVRNKILWQAISYKLGKKDNKDDWLDAGAYGMDMRANHWEDIISGTRVIQQESQHKVITNNTPF